MIDNHTMRNETVHYCYLESPVGRLLVAGSDECLIAISFPSGHGARSPLTGWREDASRFPETARQISEYFGGERTEFELPFEMAGNSFQRSVWEAIGQIPYGETRTYGEIADEIGLPVSASRAVGTACGENPIPVVVPCHRVVGSNGKLTGFGGGIETKRFLLDLEFRTRPPADTLFGAQALD